VWSISLPNPMSNCSPSEVIGVARFISVFWTLKISPQQVVDILLWSTKLVDSYILDYTYSCRAHPGWLNLLVHCNPLIPFLCFVTLDLLFLRHGVRKSIRSVKNWVLRCWCGYRSAARCRLFAYGPADATASQDSIISHFNPDCFTFLIPSYPGCPGKEAVKWM